MHSVSSNQRGASRPLHEDIEQLPEIGDVTFAFESRRSVTALQELARQLEETEPLSEGERLENELQQAVKVQAFARAAALRGRIRELRARLAEG